MSNRPPRPLTLPPRRANTGDLLLRAASQAIVEQGTLDIGFGEVAAASGLSKALIRYHFESIAGLLRALAARDAAEMAAAIRLLLGERATRETIERPLAEIVRLHLDRPYGPGLMRLAVGSGWTEVAASAARPVFGALREIMKQGAAVGTFEAVPPLLVYLDIMAACDALFGQDARLASFAATVGATVPTGGERREHLVERILAGVRRRR